MIKNTGIKTYFKKKINKFFFKNYSESKFPLKGSSSLPILIKIFFLWLDQRKFKKTYSFAHLVSFPSFLTTFIWKLFIPFNPNNIGNWSIKEIKTSGTRTFEKITIAKMIDLYRANKNDIEGYITSGSTEGNIYSAWLGVSKFEKLSIKRGNVCLLQTNLTHYSINKTSRLLGIKNKVIKINPQYWGMDPNSLKNSINKLIKKGYKGFIIPLTIGYTLTGTSDPIKKINQIIKTIKTKHQNIEIFCWIDAAYSGMIEPFVSTFTPFEYECINTITVDFHKFAKQPYPSGIVLYKKNLRKHIEQPIDYLSENDSTLLGSRSGIPAISIWGEIEKYGINGYKSKINKCINKKNKFLKKFKNNDKVEVISREKSLSACIMINDEKYKKIIAKKYDLLFKKVKIKLIDETKQSYMAKVFFV